MKYVNLAQVVCANMHLLTVHVASCRFCISIWTENLLTCFDSFFFLNGIFRQISISLDKKERHEVFQASDVHFSHSVPLRRTLILFSFMLAVCLRWPPPLRENNSVQVTTSAGFSSCCPSCLGEAAWQIRSWRKTRTLGCYPT